MTTRKSLTTIAFIGSLTMFAAPIQAVGSEPTRIVRNECTIIDNDFDIDDLMAIPLVIGNKHVAAIVQSEGYTLPEQAAPAVDRLVNQIPDQPNNRKIPIIVGGKQINGPNLNRWSWLPFFRSMLNQANGLIPNKPQPWPMNKDYPQAVAELVKDCKNVSILIIGTYTSFNNYIPMIRDKIARVVIMGQPIGDDSRTPGRESFNCNYDLDACKKAMPILQGLKTYFVDVPRLDGCHDTTTPAAHCYNPSLSMVVGKKADGVFPAQPGLLRNGLPGQLRNALLNNISCSKFYTTQNTIGKPCSSRSSWEPSAVATGPGGEMLLWDQTAAIFMVNPDLFSLYFPPDSPQLGGKHYEPTLINGSHSQTIEQLRKYWTNYTNNSVQIK